MTPDELFQEFKNKKVFFDKNDLDKIYKQAFYLANKYHRTGQIVGLKKILFIMSVLEKEKILIDLGINQFIYKDTIIDYVDNPDNRVNGNSRVVKLIELKNYPREIPDEIVGVIEKTKNIFDEFLVLYTDYTNKEERRRKADKIYRDPILFGIFINDKKDCCIDRFYILGDWEDEYCNLTVDKLIEESSKKDIIKPVVNPKSLEELKAIVDAYKSNNSDFMELGTPIIVRKTFFQKVKSFFFK